MSVEARTIDAGTGARLTDCAGCGGDLCAPLAGVVSLWRAGLSAVGITIAICEECGRDLANAVGELCAGGRWLALVPRKRRPVTPPGARIIWARSISPGIVARPTDCAGCGGGKGHPLAGLVSVQRAQGILGITLAICEECGRDLANAVGFLCVRDEGWSKLEARKQQPAGGRS